MIAILGNQFSTQLWIVFGSSESLRLPEKCALTAMKNDLTMWTTVQNF